MCAKGQHPSSIVGPEPSTATRVRSALDCHNADYEYLVVSSAYAHGLYFKRGRTASKVRRTSSCQLVLQMYAVSYSDDTRYSIYLVRNCNATTPAVENAMGFWFLMSQSLAFLGCRNHEQAQKRECILSAAVVVS